MKSLRNIFTIVFFSSLTLNSCLVIENQFSGLPPGIWRATLNLDSELIVKDEDKKFIASNKDNELPFNFEVVYPSPDSMNIILHNGDERIVVDEVLIGINKATSRDTLRINFPIYDSYIEGFFEEDIIEGRWVIPAKNNYSIPFLARYGQAHRFSTLNKGKAHDLEGKWKVLFGTEDEKSVYPAIGEFKQNGRIVTGTFMTETGDYRFLEGIVEGDKLYLSCFDGSHAFLFQADINPDGTLEGFFKSGKHYFTLWTAVKDENYTLPDPDSLTYLKDGFSEFDFSVLNEKGQEVTLEDDYFLGRPGIIQIMGTWCPNCRDETKFLVDYLAKNDLNIAVAAIAFERSSEFKNAIKAIKRYKEKMDIPYPIYFGGDLSKKGAAEKFPMLNAVISYPTLIFLNKDGEVIRIHTGFSGPATSAYRDFEKSFEETINKIK